ncbi:LysM peptidoglycan-binding domain-containing protein [Loktanella sp. F6476L]|uniref:LysM peptidoglycan-binding domain-containing protein n=1 Tax=Loktanella sp. F6476L TaxID=2926405 RepID=UPI001FF2C125|nr:LysM peptidoglycan-binding domain-containing protein [Loktanella sp. F6476L]MCK0121240.1 LysM peptidoglycan-binding domain-containing protein [Loktanella sp. F6476L]
MNNFIKGAVVCAITLPPSISTATQSNAIDIACGQTYTVVSGDTLSGISLRAYGSLLYQPIYTANVDTIGANPDMIYIGQNFMVPCLSDDGTVVAAVEDQLIFTFNKASAPPFIINSGIVDAYLAEIAEVTEGRVTFVDPEVMNRDHAAQLDLVTSGAVDATYALNSHLAGSHPLLQLSMEPMFGGSAEQTAVSMWRLHEDYLAKADYFPEAELLGFIASPAAHIWRDESMPVVAGEGIAAKNDYAIPYFDGLDTRGPAAMRAEVADWTATYEATHDNDPTFFLAHGAAIALGIWNEESTVSVMEVDNGLYTPTFSVVMSNDAWAQISDEDQAAIREVSGEALAHRSAAWDDFDNSFRSRMLDLGLNFAKADKALLDDLWLSSLTDLNAWTQAATDLGIPANEAVNAYLADLRSLENRLMYRSDETYVDQHPFVTGGL